MSLPFFCISLCKTCPLHMLASYNQLVVHGGRTQVAWISCRHIGCGTPSGHKAGLINSTHSHIPEHTLLVHFSTGQRLVTLLPLQKKLGEQSPWQGFSWHSALRNLAHCSPAQLSGHSVAALGQLFWAATAATSSNDTSIDIIFITEIICPA